MVECYIGSRSNHKIASAVGGGTVFMVVALNCSPCSRSLTHQPSALSHSPAVTEGSDPTTVVSSRCPRAFTRRTQKPLSSLWKVTRSIRPEISSVAGLRSGIAAFICGDSLSHGGNGIRRVVIPHEPGIRNLRSQVGARQVVAVLATFSDTPPTAPR